MTPWHPPRTLQRVPANDPRLKEVGGGEPLAPLPLDHPLLYSGPFRPVIQGSRRPAAVSSRHQEAAAGSGDQAVGSEGRLWQVAVAERWVPRVGGGRVEGTGGW